jgi:hypothetical protein
MSDMGFQSSLIKTSTAQKAERAQWAEEDALKTERREIGSRIYPWNSQQPCWIMRNCKDSERN